MPTSPTEALVTLTAAVSMVGAVVGARLWLHRRRRFAFRAAAVRAGLDPGEGPWVEAPCGATKIEARELFETNVRRNATRQTVIKAWLPCDFPAGFLASTNELSTGILRLSFPTASRKHTVYVRGRDDAETRAFVSDVVREALASGFAAAPDAELAVDGFKLSTLRWYRAAELEAIFAGFARVCRALAPVDARYR